MNAKSQLSKIFSEFCDLDKNLNKSNCPVCENETLHSNEYIKINNSAWDNGKIIRTF